MEIRGGIKRIEGQTTRSDDRFCKPGLMYSIYEIETEAKPARHNKFSLCQETASRQSWGFHMGYKGEMTAFIYQCLCGVGPINEIFNKMSGVWNKKSPLKYCVAHM